MYYFKDQNPEAQDQQLGETFFKIKYFYKYVTIYINLVKKT